MQTLWQDLSLAWRTLRKTPGFAIPALLTLALGIGASATILTLADSVLLRPLNVEDVDRLVHVYQHRPGQPLQPLPLSHADYQDFRERANSFESLAAHYATAPMHVVMAGEPLALTGSVVTASYFEVLRLRPSIGRFFLPAEDRTVSGDPPAVISDGLWSRQFNRAASAIGSTIQINAHAFTIVGISPRGFSGVHPSSANVDVLIPTSAFSVGYHYCDGFSRDCAIVEILGRLRPGISMAAAQSELDGIARDLAVAYPDTNAGHGVRLAPARGRGYGSVPDDERQMSILLSLVSLVLLIACANVAGLQLARATGRRKEISVRLALGASRGRVVRQLLTESLVLAGLGTVLGLLVAVWGNALLEPLYTQDNAGHATSFPLTLRGTVIGASALVALASAFIFGLAPALQASRADVITTLKDEGASGGGHRARLRQTLVTAQIAFTVLPLVYSALLVQSVNHVYAGPGFDPGPIIMVRLRPSLVDYPRPAAQAFQREVIRRVEAMPGVVTASPSVMLTLLGGGARGQVAAQAGADATSRLDAFIGHGGARYFHTIGVPLLNGRDFSDADASGAPLVTIVNEVLARRLWPSGNAVGASLFVNGEPHTVIGVVRDAQYYAAGEPPRGQLFLSYWQPHGSDPFLDDSRLFIRVTGHPQQMIGAIRREVAAVDPNVPISEDYPLSDRLSYVYQPVRTARTMLVGFAMLAVVLSAIGLYGMLSYSVSGRLREIGVRIAFGARRHDIAALVVRDALAMSVIGVTLGVTVAWMTTRLLETLLYGVDTHDLGSFVVAPLLLVGVALLATYLPARRAANVTPMEALRRD